MCENKEKTGDSPDPPTIVPTVEGSNVIAGLPEPNKRSAHFEKALEETKFGKFNYLLIILCGLILSNVVLETLGISFVLPVSQCDLHLTIQQQGIVSAVAFAGIISSSHLWGFLADTTGRRKVMRPTLLIGFIVTVFSSFATNFWVFVLLRFINGFCISGGSATVYAYLGEFHTAGNRSRAIMGAAFIFGAGACMLPALAWLVINQEWRFIIPFLDMTYKPWRLFMVICGIPGFICGLCLYKIPESPKFLLSQDDEKQTLEILQKIFHINTGKPCEQYPISRVLEEFELPTRPKKESTKRNPAAALLRSMWVQTQPLINRQYLRITVLICTMQFWTFFTSNGLFMWFPYTLNGVAEFMSEYPNNRSHICEIVNRKQAILAAAAQNVSMSAPALTEVCNETLELSTFHNSLLLELLYTSGFAVIGGIVNIVGKRGILFVCLAGCGACGIIAVYVNIPQIALYLYLIQLLCGLSANVLNAATVDLYPTQLRAMAVCISLMIGRLGSVVGANIFGALISHHCESAFLTSGISLVIAGFLSFFIPKPPKGLSNATRRASLISMTGN